MDTKLSIIIPCYNMGAYLQETLDSITSYPNPNDYEIIIVNDGSTDQQTIELLKSLDQQGFFVLNQVNMGLGKARNNGIKLAKGEYILPLDADNKIRHSYISESITLFEQDVSIDVIYSNKQNFEKKNNIAIVPDFNFPLLCHKNYIDACAVFRKSIWEKVNGYDENMPVMGYEDWDFWLRISLQGSNFRHINIIGYDYRVRETSMITSADENYNKIRNYMLNKKDLAIIRSINTTYTEARKLFHLKNSKEYKIGKLLLMPFRWVKKTFN